ncbi:oxidoreductase-like protein [Trichoderma velutinum]
MSGYPSSPPENGVSFTSILQTNTYPYIDSKTQSNHIGRSIFISGGNRGIGKAVAISFAQAGASFIGLGCNDGFGSAKEDIESAARKAGHSAPQVLCLHLDVTDGTSVTAAAATVHSVASGLDVLVNNAGFMTKALPVTEADDELWWKTLEVNLKGVFLMSKHFTPLLIGKENGLKTMVNINSVAAHNLRPNASAYGISKWSVLKFTEFLLVEQSKQGLLAFSVHPGAIMTELALAMPKETHAMLGDKPELTGDTIAFLTQKRREWLAGRYLSCNWDMEEFLGREEEIVKGEKLKLRLTV